MEKSEDFSRDNVEKALNTSIKLYKADLGGFEPSASQPILSIIEHFKLPVEAAYALAHEILLKLQGLEAPKSKFPHGDTYFATFKSIGRTQANDIYKLMIAEIKKHRGL